MKSKSEEINLQELMNLLGVSEREAMKLILSGVSPPNPSTLRQSWSRGSNFGNNSPTTQQFWKKLEDSNFRCISCGSQIRLTFNHKDSNPKNHNLENLEVLCFDCNKNVSKKPTKNKDHHLKLALKSIQIWKETGSFPLLKNICKELGFRQTGGATYMLRYLKKRLEKL